MDRMYRLDREDGSYTLYMEQGGAFYRMNFNYWEKGGYAVPQGKKKISEKEFLRMAEAHGVEILK